MYWPTSIEGYVFWMINCYVAIFVFLWIFKWITDYLERRDKLRKKVEFWGLSALGIIYLYCLFSYVRTLGRQKQNKNSLTISDLVWTTGAGHIVIVLLKTSQLLTR